MKTFIILFLLPAFMGLNSPLIGLGWFDGTGGIVLNLSWCILCAALNELTRVG